MLMGRHHPIFRCGSWGQAAVAAVVSLEAALPTFSCPYEEARSVHRLQVRAPQVHRCDILMCLPQRCPAPVPWALGCYLEQPSGPC